MNKTSDVLYLNPPNYPPLGVEMHIPGYSLAICEFKYCGWVATRITEKQK